VTDLKFLPYGHQTIEPDDIEAVAAVLRSSHLTTGPAVDRFEEALAAQVSAGGAVAVMNGTAALHAACSVAGVGEGDEVIVPAITFLATANCARYLNAEPIFADVDPDTGLLIPEEVERLGKGATRAVILVHLNGAPADMSAIRAAAERVGAIVIEDAAHALGAVCEGGPIGSCGPHSAMAAFSFHPVKQITTGEGGAVTTNDPELLRGLQLFRNHGMVRDAGEFESESPGPWYYEQQLLGHNFRMTDMQAALGTSQLAKLGRFVARRRQLAARYDELFSALPGVAATIPRERRADCAYHLYSVSIDFEGLGVRRADVMDELQKRGIGTQVHYIPLPMQPYYANRGWRVEDFPGARRYYERTLSLPLFPSMEDGDVDRVVDCLSEVLRERGGL